MSGGRAALPSAIPPLPAGVKPTYPVVIDWTHPLARGIRFAWIPNRNAKDNELRDITKVNKTKSWSSVDNNGSYLDFSAVNSEIQIARHSRLEPPHVTVAVRANIDDRSATDVYSNIITKDKNTWSSPYYSYGIRVRHGVYDRAECVFGGSTNAGVTLSDKSMTGVYNNNAWFVASYMPGRALFRLYDNAGVLLDSGTNASDVGDIGYFDTDLHIGDTHTGTLPGMADSRVLEVFIWGEAKSAGQIDDFVRNPYQFLKPAGP